MTSSSICIKPCFSGNPVVSLTFIVLLNNPIPEVVSVKYTSSDKFSNLTYWSILLSISVGPPGDSTDLY